MPDDYDPHPETTRVTVHEVIYICDTKGCGYKAKLSEIDPLFVIASKSGTLVTCPSCIARWLAKYFPKLRPVPVAPRHETDAEAADPLAPRPHESLVSTRRYHKHRGGGEVPAVPVAGVTDATGKTVPVKAPDEDSPFPDQ
jgi:hypothetical protein